MTIICMFFLSFAPLWISIVFVDFISILNSTDNICTELISIGCIFLFSMISLIHLLLTLNTKKHNGTEKYIILSVEEEKTITSEYLLSYILPLFAFDFTIWNQVVLFLFYFLTLAYLCIKHNHFSVNIVLELLHYRFYQCTLENDDGVTIEKNIISREKLINHKTETISIKAINNEYSLDLLNWSKN